jgi:hypothetical protein
MEPADLRPPDEEPLSAALLKFVRSIMSNSIQSCSDSCFTRLNRLIKHTVRYKENEVLDGRLDEYILLKKFVKKIARQKDPTKRLYLVACEYFFDDGAFVKGQGDALLFDASSGSIIVLEIKMQTTNGRYKEKRNQKVRDQTTIYAARLKSWLVHLCAINPMFNDAFKDRDVVRAILTDNDPHHLVYI